MGKIKEFIRKTLYVIGANLISLIVSLITTLYVPKFLGNDISQYGYLQIYMFYISYVGLFHFGWCDGIFLRDGGKRYQELDKAIYSSQFWLLTLAEFIIANIILVFGSVFTHSSEYTFIIVMVSINIFIFIPTTMLQYFLQTTNRMKEYASITSIGRSLYGVFIILILLMFPAYYKIFIIADVIAKIIALIVAIAICRDIVFYKPCNIRTGVLEAKKNISVGINLMFANIAGMLITGIVRWGIQNHWDVATYGKISLTLSVSNLLMTFISAIALVLYPTLRRMNIDSLPGIYGKINNVLMVLLLGCLIFYYPVEKGLSIWLPQYSESLRYMSILFPMCIYTAKMTLLIQTYMNTYRMEKEILKVNIRGVFVAIISTIVSVYIFDNLTLAMLTMVVNTVFRSIYAEIILSKKINIKPYSDIVYELVLTIVFIFANWLYSGLVGIIIYLIVYACYLIVKRKSIRESVIFVKNR